MSLLLNETATNMDATQTVPGMKCDDAPSNRLLAQPKPVVAPGGSDHGFTLRGSYLMAQHSTEVQGYFTLDEEARVEACCIARFKRLRSTNNPNEDPQVRRAFESKVWPLEPLKSSHMLPTDETPYDEHMQESLASMERTRLLHMFAGELEQDVAAERDNFDSEYIAHANRMYANADLQEKTARAQQQLK